MAMNGYNFTERVRKVLTMARMEAARLQHDFVGTEHMLLGLLLEGEGVACFVFDELRIDRDQMRARVEETIKRGGSAGGAPDLPYTGRAKKALELSMAAARDLRHSYVGTEHLLLGLIAEQHGIAAHILAEVGLTADPATRIVLRLLGQDHVREPREAGTETGSLRKAISAVLPGRDDSDEIIGRLGLVPHPEGGHYKEVYRSAMRVSAGERERAAVTTIYYYLRRSEISKWHVVESDEIWHAYATTGFELLDYDPKTRELKSLTFGTAGDPQGWVHIVPAGHWQAGVARRSALMGCTVAPGFEFADFKLVRNVEGHEKLFTGELERWKQLL